jgi:hypothetical protein
LTTEDGVFCSVLAVETVRRIDEVQRNTIKENGGVKRSTREYNGVVEFKFSWKSE